MHSLSSDVSRETIDDKAQFKLWRPGAVGRGGPRPERGCSVVSGSKHPSMQVSAHFSYGNGFAFSPTLAQGVLDLQAMEDAGLSVAWVGESYWLDAPTMLGYLAAQTTRLRLGTSILSVYSRSAASMAQLAAGLDFVSDGRAILGLGTSGRTVVESWHDTPFARPASRLVSTVRTCRAVLRSERIPLDSGSATGPSGTGLRLIHKPIRASVPIYVAAIGPKLVEFAAAEADGWLTSMFLPERADAVWGESLSRGLLRRAADTPALQVVAGGIVAIDDDTDHWLQRARERIAFYIGAMGPPGNNHFYDLAVRYGFGEEAERIREHYIAKDPSRATAAVPLELARNTNLIGPASFVRERVKAYRSAGVTMLNIVPLAGDVGSVVEALALWAR